GRQAPSDTVRAARTILGPSTGIGADPPIRITAVDGVVGPGREPGSPGRRVRWSRDAAGNAGVRRFPRIRGRALVDHGSGRRGCDRPAPAEGGPDASDRAACRCRRRLARRSGRRHLRSPGDGDRSEQGRDPDAVPHQGSPPARNVRSRSIDVRRHRDRTCGVDAARDRPLGSVDRSMGGLRPRSPLPGRLLLGGHAVGVRQPPGPCARQAVPAPGRVAGPARTRDPLRGGGRRTRGAGSRPDRDPARRGAVLDQHRTAPRGRRSRGPGAPHRRVGSRPPSL
ncbi:MAG: hypothetical protein AVDCRST_MAG66-4391, partial [uncultured Pseudonocardia sp.]